MMSPKKPETIGDALLTRVLRGDFGPDKPLPREVDLAETYGVSRGTVRAAVQALEAQGIVSVLHGRAGAEVHDASEWSLFDVPLLSTVLRSPMRREVMPNLLECRLIVAGEAAALAAQRATPEQVKELSSLLEAARGAVGDIHEGPLPTPELAFLRSVMHAAHNRFLTRAAMAVEEALVEPDQPLKRRDITQLERILEAVTTRDPRAARDAMRAHLKARHRA